MGTKKTAVACLQVEDKVLHRLKRAQVKSQDCQRTSIQSLLGNYILHLLHVPHRAHDKRVPPTEEGF